MVQYFSVPFFFPVTTVNLLRLLLIAIGRAARRGGDLAHRSCDLVRLPTRLRKKQSHERHLTSSCKFPGKVTPLSLIVSLTLGEHAANLL